MTRDQGQRSGAEILSDAIRDTVTVPIGALKTHPRNYKKHPQDQMVHIMKSLELHGYYRNIVVARDFTILAGHGVVEGAKRLGKLMVPVIQLDLDPDEPRALKVLVGDNEIAEIGEVDDRKLIGLLQDVMTQDELIGTGYNEMQLQARIFVSRPESEIKDRRAAAEYLGLPFYDAEDPSPKPKLVITFESDAERERLMGLIGAVTVARKDGPTWSVWWPARARDVLKAARFGEETERPT